VSSRRFEGKVALVTGAASGIGRETAEAFAREGACLLLADVNQTDGEEVAREIRARGSEARFLRTDVSSAEQVEEMVSVAVRTFGRLDISVNDAGVGGIAGPLAECSEENFDRVISINLKGVFLGMKYQIKQMLKQGGGVIVNLTSVSGMVGFPNLPAYTASKHGVIGLTRAAALEYAKRGIRINAVAAGMIWTGMTAEVAPTPEELVKVIPLGPIGRLGRVEEIAQAILYLCSDQAAFAVGTVLVLDGGYLAQ
jgi:NAD(P)-dependent dehydrogenase (short-subunit alcohol dehydrogenase family)